MPSTPPREPALRPKDRGHAAFVAERRALFDGKPLGTEVEQHVLGDCFFLASLASFAQRRPEEVEEAVKEHGSGSYAVRFYHYDPSTKTATPREVIVDAKLPEKDGHVLYATTVSGRGLWVALFEKAYAELRRGYSILDRGGDPGAAIEALTGRGARTTWIGDKKQAPDEIWEALEHGIAARQITLAGTSSDDGARAALAKERADGEERVSAHERESFDYHRLGLVANHEYSVWGLSGHGDERTITLRNPWAHRTKHTTDDGIFTLPFHEILRVFSDVTVGG
jgi:Calpain family cysteine protease